MSGDPTSSKSSLSATWSFHGATVIVTGAAGGIGARCAARLLEAGAYVVAHDLDLERLREVSLGWSPHHDLVSGDLCKDGTADGLVEAAVDRGCLRVLVHAAGVMETRPFLELTTDAWRRMIDINLNASFALVRAAGEAMFATNGGSIVLISSVAGRGRRPSAAHYAASKAGLLSLTRSAAAALGPRVRVNAICPGVVLTRMWDGIIHERDIQFGVGAGQAYLNEVLRLTCLGRPGEVDEIVNAVLFLASDASSYITGQAVNVDGGLEMS